MISSSTSSASSSVSSTSKEYSSWSSSSLSASSSSNSSSSSTSLEYSSWSSSSGLSSSSSSVVIETVDSYVTRKEVIEILGNLGITVTTAQISAFILTSTKLLLDKLTQTEFGLSNRMLYLDGRGNETVFSTFTPINSLKEVVLIGKDLTETTYTLSGTNRQIWWDRETGIIQIIKHTNEDIAVDAISEYSTFEEGVRNVRVKGNFGKPVDDLIKLAQCLLILKTLATNNPGKYSLSFSSEKIGNYSYSIGVGKSITTFENFLKSTLDVLTGPDQLVMESV